MIGAVIFAHEANLRQLNEDSVVNVQSNAKENYLSWN